MPNVLGFLRHFCNGGQSAFLVLGEVDKKGEAIGWGIMMGGGGPSVGQWDFGYCPWCAEQFPHFVKDWDKQVDSKWSPFGIGQTEKEEGDNG